MHRRNAHSLLSVLLLWGWGGAEAQDFEWEAVPPMPTARESLGACAADGRVFAIGGFPARSDPGIATNERYDPVSRSWSTAFPMPTARRLPAVAAVNGRCYAIGGRISDTPSPLAAVEAYDPVTDSWQVRASLPSARFAHRAVAHDGIIYVAGGTDGQTVFDDFDAYDVAGNSWRSLPDLPAPVALMGMVAHEGEVWILGGTRNGFIGTSQVHVYDIQSRQWRAGPNLPAGRFSLEGAVVNGWIYAIGGTVGSGASDQVTVLNPATGEWAEAPSLRTTRARFATAVLGDQIYALGGTVQFEGQNHVGLSTVESLRVSAAPPLTINPGLNDAWANTDTDGQGFYLSVFPDLGVMALAWFTYDLERPPGNVGATLGGPGQRWLSALGGWEGNVATLTVENVTGGRFDRMLPEVERDNQYGTITIEFLDCDNATLSYEIPGLSLSGEMAITRIVKDNVVLCEAMSGMQDG